MLEQPLSQISFGSKTYQACIRCHRVAEKSPSKVAGHARDQAPVARKEELREHYRNAVLYLSILLFGLSTGCSGQPTELGAKNENTATISAADLFETDRQLSLEQVEQKIGELIFQANQLESEFKFEEAVDVWANIIPLVHQHAGDQSWQATNARLSLETARRQVEFNEDQITVLREFVDRQQIVTESLVAGNLETALDAMTWMIVATEMLLGADSHSVGRIKLRMGQLLFQSGEIELATDYLRQAFEINKSKLGLVHPESETNAFLLGHGLIRTGSTGEGLVLLEQAEQIAMELWGIEHAVTASRMNDLGVAYHAAGELEQARLKLDEALARRKQLSPDWTAAVGETHRNLGVVYLDLQQFELASEHLHEALKILGNTTGESSILTLDTRTRLATVKMLTKEYMAAEGQLRQVMHQFETTVQDSQGLAKACFQLGIALGYQGQYHEAEPLLNRALSIQRSELGQWHPATVETLQALAVLYERIGQPDKAHSINESLIRIKQ